ncbi:MAG TPA: hypothetical protein VIL49_04240 [Capillimicrobium sp.]|jgi:DNA-binding transcriptional regulator/RsmH inhibitor MraZ
MADERDWLEVTLDSGSRRGLAEAIETHSSGDDATRRLVRILRSSRDEILLDKEQAVTVLDALNRERTLSALRARLEAFLGQR